MTAKFANLNISITTKHQINVKPVLGQETQMITLFVILVHLDNILTKLVKVLRSIALIVLQKTAS